MLPKGTHLPTTNGEHCTWDCVKVGEAIGAKTIELEWVQVHPTGLVKPDDQDAKIKFWHLRLREVLEASSSITLIKRTFSAGAPGRDGGSSQRLSNLPVQQERPGLRVQ